jgi:very-short-patch-repair endonuclease
MTNLASRARALRKNSTDAERLLWKHLKAKQMLGLKFRRQEEIGRYITDFVCYEAGLVVEADGGQHLEQLSWDAERTCWLSGQGFKVLRFWNHDVLGNIEEVLEVIRLACLERMTTSPSPRSSP